MSGAGKGDRRGSRRRTVEGDEARLWQEVMRDVRPLSGRRISIPEERPSAQRPGPETPTRPAQAASAPRPAGELPELGPGVAPGVDKRTLRRLHRGQLEIEARIDLHGLTQEEAWRALHAFLDGARKADRRSVLVVTGKGETQGRRSACCAPPCRAGSTNPRTGPWCLRFAPPGRRMAARARFMCC